MIARILRGIVLNPLQSHKVDCFIDGAIAVDEHDRIVAVGQWRAIASQLPSTLPPVEHTAGVICPPFIDAHIHIPQHPIRGKFVDGVPDDAPHGRLLAGLLRNVFPAEARCSEAGYTQTLVEEFAADTLAHGVVGGAAYMTVHPAAAGIALSTLGPHWQVGPVLMNQNCPAYLRNDESVLPAIESLAKQFGQRVIVTDRFAVAVDSPLRRAAAALAERTGLRMQTHLNEQIGEKNFVERDLYPGVGTYTDVYDKDGLLDRQPILAHCVHMSDAELSQITGRGASIAHCPTSNALLGSGTMPLDRVIASMIDWAICTDVGASPTTSLLAEMVTFLKVHAGRSSAATPSMALARVTVAPARMLGIDREIGTFTPGRPLSFVEIASSAVFEPEATADAVIAAALLDGEVAPKNSAEFDALAAGGVGDGKLAAISQEIGATAARLDAKVQAVTLAGERVWQRGG